MKAKEDLRIIKTKKSLYEALANLMEEKQFENIKVSEICNVALVNRTTFYSHFNDKYELLDSMMKEMKDTIILKLREEIDDNASNKEFFLNAVDKIIDEFNINKKEYIAILINNRNSIAIDIVKDTIKDEVLLKLSESHIKTTIPLDILRNYYMGAVLGVLEGWLENPKLYTKEEVLNYLNKLLPDYIG